MDQQSGAVTRKLTLGRRKPYKRGLAISSRSRCAFDSQFSQRKIHQYSPTLHIACQKSQILQENGSKTPTTLIHLHKYYHNNTSHPLIFPSHDQLSLASLPLSFPISTPNLHPQTPHAFHSTPLRHDPPSIPHFPFHLPSNLLCHPYSNIVSPNSNIPHPNIPFPMPTKFPEKMRHSPPSCFQSRGIDVPV